MIEHKSRQNKKRKCLKIDNLLKKNRIELGQHDYSNNYSNNYSINTRSTPSMSSQTAATEDNDDDNENENNNMNDNDSAGGSTRPNKKAKHRHAMVSNYERRWCVGYNVVLISKVAHARGRHLSNAEIHERWIILKEYENYNKRMEWYQYYLNVDSEEQSKLALLIANDLANVTSEMYAQELMEDYLRVNGTLDLW